jgi:Branched-chain amino acid aminotransferase/4-amino-4-deoxychorismate lyase
MLGLILHNDSICSASDVTLQAGQVGLLAGWGVFSTIRVKNGQLFAFDRHFARMKRDAALLRVPFPDDPQYIESRLLRLVAANQAEEATLRVVVVRNKGSVWEGPSIARDFDLIALMTGLKDWGSGVKLGIIPQARHAQSVFAGTKVLAWGFNLTWYEQAQERGWDEVILLNERDEVCECTSANIFVSQGGQVWTPPLSSGCLPGITREVILNEIRVPGITVGEKPLLLKDLKSADEVFITSTTRDLLPVVAVEGVPIRSQGDIRVRLQAAFLKYVQEQVCERTIS